MSLVFLESVHPSIKNVVGRILRKENAVPFTSVRDFDTCEYFIAVEEEPVEEVEEGEVAPEPKATVILSLKHTVPVDVLNTFGNLRDTLKALIPEKGILMKDAEDAELAFTLRIPADHDKFDDLLARASTMRVQCLIAPFTAQFAAYQKDPASVKPLCLTYRPSESCYIYSNKGNLYVVFTVVVNDADDHLFTKQFLQTFFDAKKLEKSIGGAPGFNYTVGKMPIDMPPRLAKEPEDESVFWCTFQLFRKQIEQPKDADKTIQSLVNFRNYVAYHIRCCRSQMHAKMRARVETSMQVLNRAKTTTTGRSRVQIK